MSNEQAQHPPDGGSLASQPVAGFAEEHEWTPEPWMRNGMGQIGSKSTYRIDGSSERVGLEFLLTPAVLCFIEADAERIVGCVNALAGISDPATELARLRHRDALAGELLKVLAALWQDDWDGMGHEGGSDRDLCTIGCIRCEIENKVQAVLARSREEDGS